MRNTFFSFLLLIAASTVSAQVAEEKPGRGIQIRAFAFALFEDIGKLQLRSEKRVLGELELPTEQLRARTSVSSRAFAFGVEENDSFRILGKVALPDVGSDFILVYAPTKDGYRAFPVRADDPNFRGNDTVVFNFSTHRLGIMLGTAKQTIAPSENSRLRPAFPADATFYQALFTYEKEGKFIPFNNTRWPVNSNTKALLFVSEEPSTGKLAYRSVTELAASEVASPTQKSENGGHLPEGQ